MNTTRNKIPHTYVILIGVMLLAALLTYIVPAGEYTRVEDPVTQRTIVDPDSFTPVEQNPTGFFDFLQAIPKGMTEAASISFFIFIIAGSFEIINSTGAVEAGVGKFAYSLRNRRYFLIPFFVILFAIFGGTIGMSEETIIFIPIGIALARALDFDAMVGTAMITLGAGVGFSSGFMNPFTVGVAQGIAELPLFSGIKYRLLILVTMIIVTIIYIMYYAKKVEKDKKKSLVYNLEIKEKSSTIDFDNLLHLSNAQKLVLISFVIGLALIVYGVFKYKWYITELAAAFLAIGIFCGLIYRMSPSKIAEEFVKGAKGIVFGALVVGVARGILVVLQDGLILDSIIFYLSATIQSLSRNFAVLAMYFIQIVINFFIPSGSGQAAVTMPVMAPMSDVLSINRQVAVLAFQFGDGFTNSIIPTSGTLLAVLSVGKIRYEQWFKFVAPLMLIWIGLGAVFLVIANFINYGPF